MAKVQITEAEGTVYDLLHTIINKHFSELKNAHIKLLFYDKCKKSRGNMVFAYIRIPSNVENFFALTADGEKYDYLIFIDKNIWNLLEEADRIRILRHELRHCFVDFDKSSNPYRLCGHDMEDFYEEVRLAQEEGDLEWKRRVSRIASEYYDEN